MRLYRCYEATTEIERLNAKHHGLWESVEQFERLLSNGFTHGHDRYAGLRLWRGDEPAAIWKARVIYQPLGGKRSGLRYVYERLVIDSRDHAVALTVYIHQEGSKEADVMDRIRQRSRSVDATAAGLQELEQPHTEGLAE